MKYMIVMFGLILALGGYSYGLGQNSEIGSVFSILPDVRMIAMSFVSIVGLLVVVTTVWAIKLEAMRKKRERDDFETRLNQFRYSIGSFGDEY